MGNKIQTTIVSGEIEEVSQFSTRRCEYRVQVTLSRYEDKESHPAYSQTSRPVVEEMEWVDLKLTLFDADSEVIGSYETDEMSVVERAFWTRLVDIKVRKDVANGYGPDESRWEDELGEP